MPRPRKTEAEDKELQQYRDILLTPDHFEEGFGWQTVAGAIMMGFLMMPGSMYLDLVMGQSLGPAARWVTVILFLEVAKRSFKTLKQQEVFVLFYMAGMIMSSPFSGLLWNQFLVQSDAARAFGVTEQIPSWVAPQPAVIAEAGRTFFTGAWAPALLLVVVGQILARIDHWGLGYVLYRITSDVERLPFPMAPVGAMGSIALAESTTGAETWRWRCFTIGSMLGLGFGVLYVGIPSITGALFAEPMFLLPIPWAELTPRTERVLPAVATGFTFDMGLFMVGMVMPFWAVMGELFGFLFTAAANPILYHHNVLTTWHEGMRTVETLFANSLDFYLSFGIGISFAIAVVGFYKVHVSFRQGVGRTTTGGEGGSIRKSLRRHPGRGDLDCWVAGLIYVASTVGYIALCRALVPGFPWLFFVCYGFLYTPLISYVTARMEGLAGQVVAIPMVREASFILSGYKGAAIWFAPIPIHNYGPMTVGFRQIELTGTKLGSIIKTEVIVFPIIMVASILFSQFLWSLAPIPSASYPYAQEFWELNALNQCLVVTSTTGGNSPFFEALKFPVVGYGLAFGLGLFGLLSYFGLPTLLVYGAVRGLGQSMPHGIFLMGLGAVVGRYHFEKRYTTPQWRRYAPVLLAGFSCGVGLIGMASIAIALISKSVSQGTY